MIELSVIQAPRTDYNRFNKFKILMHSARIDLIVKGGMPAPVEWVIYPSNVCGYKCAHCIMAREQVDHRNTLSAAAMNKIPEDVAAHGIKCVIFSGGGDPLLNPATMEVARKLKQMGVLVGINNQGYLLNDASPFDFVRYSVDAANRETYQKIHGVDGWDRVNQNIAAHAALRARGQEIEMGLAFLITPWNWQEVEAFVAWAQQYEPDFIHLRPAYLDSDYLDAKYPGGGKDLQCQIIPTLQSIAPELERKYANVYFRIDKFEGYWTPKNYSKCRATPLLAVTSGDGAFLVCQDRGIRREENYLRWGNYNTQSFSEIWYGQEHRKVIESIDLQNCPRCVENSMNEIIEHGFIKDGMRRDLL